jgi:hypothetical protein
MISDQSPSPMIAMVELLFSFPLVPALAAMAELNLADAIAAGPSDVNTLTQQIGTHAPTLARLLRFLSVHAVVRRAGPHRYELTPLWACLRSDVPASLRTLAVFCGADWNWQPWSGLVHSVRTGEPAFPTTMGAAFWPYLAAHSGAQALFD